MVLLITKAPSNISPAQNSFGSICLGKLKYLPQGKLSIILLTSFPLSLTMLFFYPHQIKSNLFHYLINLKCPFPQMHWPLKKVAQKMVQIIISWFFNELQRNPELKVWSEEAVHF